MEPASGTSALTPGHADAKWLLEAAARAASFQLWWREQTLLKVGLAMASGLIPESCACSIRHQPFHGQRKHLIPLMKSLFA